MKYIQVKDLYYMYIMYINRYAYDMLLQNISLKLLYARMQYTTFIINQEIAGKAETVYSLTRL